MNNKDKEIDRFLRVKRLLSRVGMAVSLVLIIVLVIVVLLENKIQPNNVIFIDAILLLVYLFLALLISLFVMLDKKRNKLIRKHYGNVTDDDKNKADELLKNIDILQTHYFDLNNTGKLEGYEAFVKQILTQIKNGTEVYKDDFESFKTELEQELKESEGSIDEVYTSYVSEVLELIERNLCDDL